jgi:oligopeptide transport system substrate-binding protein
LLLFAALVVLLTAGCGDAEDKSASNDLSPDQELRIRIANGVSTLDPQLAYSAEEISVVKQLFRGLFAYDEDLNVVPAVAAELPTKENGGISDDGLTYTIYLRDGAVWSDGQPVTASDFVFAFQRLFDPEAGAQGYYFGSYLAIAGASAASVGEGPIDAIGVNAPDEKTVVITLEQPQPTLTTLLALWPAVPLREDVIEQHGDAWTEPGNLISNGPFVLAEHSPDLAIELEANASYWGEDDPTLERIVYRIIPDDSAALIAYENDEIDVTTIPVPDTARFEGDEEQLRFGQLETFALQYNHASPPFDNKLVRQAFSRAIDRDAYVTSILGGVGRAATAWLPPGMPGVTANIGQEYDFSTEGARALLTEAGFEDGEGFPEVTLSIADSDMFRLTAEFLQEQLQQNLGITVNIEAVEESVFGERWQSGDFQLTLFSWFGDYADPENFLSQQFATDGGFNVQSYSNAQVDELLADALTELNNERRLALYDEVHRLIIEDQAVTPLFHPERNYLVKNNVGGLIVTALDAQPGDWFVSTVQIYTGGGAPPASEPDDE